MKKIISLLLTVAMLMSMLGIVAVAEEGNAAIFYHNANVEPVSTRFQGCYNYIPREDTVYEFHQRINESGAEHYGGFYFTQVMDFKVTDYGEGADHFTDFTFSNDLGAYHYGYSFTHKAFVVYDLYMPGSDPNAGHSILAKMSYDLELNKWYELGTRFVDHTITIYLNGVEMLSCDLWEAYDKIGKTNFADDWDWTARERPESLENDLMFFHMIDVDMYIDNYGAYSGDYDFATGTAEETYVEDSDFNSFNVNEDPSWGPWRHSDCGFSKDPNGGTAKVTYNRGEAAGHTHNFVLNTAKSATAHCLTSGYDLYECANGCGASEQRNVVAPLGHQPGYLDATLLEADATHSGVQQRICTRDGCGETYKTVVPLTGTDKALHGYTDGGNSIYNGYVGVGSKSMLALEKGVMVEFDVMPINQIKDFANILAEVGGNTHSYLVGYDYSDGMYVIKHNGEIVASSTKAFNNYEWSKWAIVRDDLKINFFVDGELLLSADVDPDIYTLTRTDNKGVTSTVSIEDCYQFVMKTDSTEAYFDNFTVAAPDFDFETRSGIVYSYLTFNDEAEYTIDKDGFIYNKEMGISNLHCISYNVNMGAGYKVESYGLPYENVTKIHQDRVMHLDMDYTNPIFGYSQLGYGDEYGKVTSAADMSALLKEKIDIEFTYDFYVYDWCTDETLLGFRNNANGELGSAFIGSHVNGQGVGNANNPTGNGFAGYDFIKQAAVIGSISEQAGGYYSDSTTFADYAIAKETWHTMTLSYKEDLHLDDEDYENDYIVVSVIIDGETVISKNYDYWSFDVNYFIFFPNFVKGYFDNFKVTINGTVYDDTDYTNAYTSKLNMLTFDGGAQWSLADGGKPTHVYTANEFPASCLSDGYTEYSCSCGDSFYTLYNLPATGHDWDDGVITKEPTGTEKGEMTYTCDSCGETYTEEVATLFTYGDLNDDGAVDSKDSSLLARFLKGAKVSINAAAADVKVNGAVDSNDASLLARFIKGAKVTLGS